MDLKKTNFIGKLHCPNCGCMYIIIDNEILSCPVCEVSLLQKRSNTCEEDASSEFSDKLNDFSGLHAKLIIGENGSQAHVLTGSANATNAALRGRNVEFLVNLTGPLS